jgi:cyclic pyranopterin phosphate synthase
MLLDTFGRVHNYLRISLTDACNFRCTYCMPDENIQFLPHQKLMQVDEIAAIAQIFVDLGVQKIRVTGGEPLVRKDVDAVLMRLSALPVALTMTTNASRLHLHWAALAAAKMQTINISLDTLQSARFAAITQRDDFAKVWQNIETAIHKGFIIKLNVVLMRGSNDDEILDFIALTQYLPIAIRFIEFMPFLGNQWQDSRVFPKSEILSRIGSHFPDIVALDNEAHSTSQNYQINGFRGTFGIISTMSQHFCGDCNRMRLTADGKLKNCLFSRTELDILSPFRHGLDIRPLIAAAINIKEKALGGQLLPDYQAIRPDELENRSMINIGG